MKHQDNTWVIDFKQHMRDNVSCSGGKKMSHHATITCSYGTQCTLSVEALDNQKIMKLDFAIKSYKVLNHGWKERDFPAHIIINDKLYLNEELKAEVVKFLDHFIEHESIWDLASERTNRGFPLHELKDLHGNPISIQESSAASQAHLWFGCIVEKVFMEKDGQLVEYPFDQGSLSIADRMHLNVDQARQLRNAMNALTMENTLATKETYRPKARL